MVLIWKGEQLSVRAMKWLLWLEKPKGDATADVVASLKVGYL